MPSYDYRCRDCGQSFTIQASMDDARDQVTCPACQARDVVRLFGGIATLGGTKATVAAGPASQGGGCCGGHCH